MCFREHKLFVKGAKMHLFQREIEFCGHILSKGSRRAAPDKLKDIEAWVPDKIRTVTQLKGFLGLTQYYAIYMENYAEHAAALTDAPRNKGTNKNISWNPRMVQAFDAIKRRMQENVVLQIANPYKPFFNEQTPLAMP